MRKTVFAGVATAVVALVVTQGTAAYADAGDTLHGGCGTNLTGVNGSYSGSEYELSVSQHADSTLSTATVSCWITVNGVEVHATRLTAGGFGLQAGELSVGFTAASTDVIQLCQQVVFLDGSTWNGGVASCSTL